MADIRRFAVTRSLFPPTTLERALETLAFVQADPIRSPARAQDLTLRPRVRGYRAGDLERRFAALPIEEDFFINYGFVTHALHGLMHPRTGLSPTASNKRAQALLAFIRERGSVHPRDVDAHFAHGRVTNYWGGSSSATTHLLELMHYKGVVRVARREAGIRIYAAREPIDAPAGSAARRERIDALIDTLVRKYAPLPAGSMAFVLGRLRYAVPHWRAELRPAIARAKQRLSSAEAGGHTWYWPAGEHLNDAAPLDEVRLLAPFDPVVWDRRRFEILWDWAYRFEAYTPAPKRKLGYYALPLLWRDRIVGWGNLAMRAASSASSAAELHATFGYATGKPPRDRSFRRELDAELDRVRLFLK